MGSPTGTMHRLGTIGFTLVGFFRKILNELRPLPDRGAATMRIVLACLLVWLIVLTFRNPMGGFSVFLVFILQQRNKTMSRLVAVFLILSLIVASLWIFAIASLSWNISWLRILLWGGMFWVNYYLMSRFPKMSIVFMLPISFGSIFCFSFVSE